MDIYLFCKFFLYNASMLIVGDKQESSNFTPYFTVIIFYNLRFLFLKFDCLD